MSYLVYLLLSAICTNGVHGYLLLSQKDNRQWSLSVHAVQTKKAILIYRLGHFAGGIFSMLFCYSYFIVHLHISWPFYIMLVAVIFEYIQAILPAEGKTEKIHTLAAYIMWVLIVLFGFSSLLAIPTNSTQKTLAPIPLCVLLGQFIYSHFNYARLYRQQMSMVALFYLAMLILVI